MTSIQRKFRCPLCCLNYLRSNFVRQFSSVVKDLYLEPFQKKLIMKRYVRTVAEYNRKATWTGKFYHSFRCTITSFSVLVPALLTLQRSMNVNDETADDSAINTAELIYWSTWGLSLGVTLLNGIYQLYSLDQTYFKASLIQEKLQAEGWHYVALSGKYSGYSDHKLAFVRFMNSIERLKMKYIQYMFLDDDKKNKNKNKKDGKDGNNENNDDTQSNPSLGIDFDDDYDIGFKGMERMPTKRYTRADQEISEKKDSVKIQKKSSVYPLEVKDNNPTTVNIVIHDSSSSDSD